MEEGVDESVHRERAVLGDSTEVLLGCGTLNLVTEVVTRYLCRHQTGSFLDCSVMEGWGLMMNMTEKGRTEGH